MQTGNSKSIRDPSSVLLLVGLTVIAQFNLIASEDAAAKLSLQLTSIQSFQGRFVQVTFDENGEILQRQTGVTAMVRPNRFLWHVEKPYVQTITMFDDVVSSYEPDLKQITHSRMEDTVDTSVVALFFDDERNGLNRYEISELADGFRLEPKTDLEIPLTSIDIHFEATTLTGIDVLDVQGLRIEYSFLGMAYNDFVPDSLFTIDVPETVEVIGDPPPSFIGSTHREGEETSPQ